MKSVKLKNKIDFQFLKESLKFTMGSYTSSIFSDLPTMILPIIILNILGEQEAAKYFIAFSISNLVSIVHESLGLSLFIEGSHGEGLRKNIVRAFYIIYPFIIFINIFMYFYGYSILGLFGKDYVSASNLLKLFVLSSFLTANYYLFTSVETVRMKLNNIVGLNFIRFILIISASFFFIPKYGSIGIGYVWIATYILLNSLVCALIYTKHA